MTALEKDVADLKLIVAAQGKQIKDLQEAKPPEPPPPPPTVFTLVPGPGADVNPDPVDVAEVNAKYPITSDYRAASLVYGASKMDLNFYDNSADMGPVARVVEFSLNGGAWLGTRSGVILVPDDLEDGVHQIRTVMYPPSGLSKPQLILNLYIATVEFTPGAVHRFVEMR